MAETGIQSNGSAWNLVKVLLIAVAVAIAALVALLTLMTVTRSDADQLRLDEALESGRNRVVAETAIRNVMLDGESARFRNVFTGTNHGRGDTGIVCGEVNGRNRFGGYAGFRRFVVGMKQGVSMIEDTVLADRGQPDPVFEKAWEGYCSIKAS